MGKLPEVIDKTDAIIVILSVAKDLDSSAFGLRMTSVERTSFWLMMFIPVARRWVNVAEF